MPDAVKLGLLDGLGRAVEGHQRFADTLTSMLSFKRQVEIFRSEGDGSAQEWQNLREDVITVRTLMQRTHFELIGTILRRAATWNLSDFSIADDFEDTLKAADPSELAQWHETAALLINENESRQLVSDANNPPGDFLPCTTEAGGSFA